ncbi:uncharacterized protein LOC142357529, partial [Convolutriloba macropyga]|uniref:uncharacterized protein LOC142357529 n=1 Tax=Convolutriloba macropyga TaxID=536237 RepID=UPI003F526A21
PLAPSINPDDQLNAAIVNQTSITLIGNLINSSDTYAVVGLLENGRRVSQFNRIQSESAADNVTLGNLEEGRNYIVEVVSVIGTSTDCGRDNASDSQTTSLAICTDPADVTVTFLEKNESTIVLQSILPDSGWEFFSVEATPELPMNYVNETNLTLPLGMHGLTRGTEYRFNLSVSVQTNCEFGTNRQQSVVAIGCTAPDYVNFADSNSSVEIFAISSSEIRIAAEINNVVANSGNMGQYKLVSVSPNLTSGTHPLKIEPNPADSDANMTIGNLFPGTSYNLTFVNTMQLCNSNRDSETTTVIHVCTKPEVPIVTVISSTMTSLTIYGNGIATASNSTFDNFSVISIEPSPDQRTRRAVDSMHSSGNLTIIGLTAGTQYSIELVTELGAGATVCSNPSTLESDISFITLCTVPNVPYLKTNNKLSVAVVNQTSITLIGRLISSSDTYAVVGLTENGARVPHFTRIQSKSGDSNVTLDNLLPGKRYSVEIVSVIGTITDCGGPNSTDSGSETFHICTDLQDVEATFLQTNSTTVELSTITPSIGWDSFSVASTPLISQTVVNESASSLPLKLYNLVPGSQYIFNVSVSITNFCDLGSNTPSSTIVTVCTIPRAPIINQEDRHKVAIINQTSITLLGTFLNSSDTYAVVGLLENGSRVPQFTRIQSESAADNVTLGSLEPGKSYTLEVVSVIGTRTDCGGNSADSQISSFNICTDPPDFEATFLPTNSTTIELSSITPRVGWDFFSVASTPSISQTVFNESASSLPLTFYDLAAGSQYKFNVSVSITNFCDLGSNTPSSTIVTVCTIPRAPIINQEDRHKVAIINQTSITLLGTFLNSSDTYAVVGLLENGSRVPQFTRIQSESAADNVTLGNLEPGRTYIAEVVSVIGASSYCGRFNETDSEITSYAFCTDPADITISLVEQNDSTVVLNSILPSIGWEFFSVESTPRLSQSYFNGTLSNLPLEMIELTRGTEYTFIVSVSVRSSCEFGTNQQSTAVAIACTTPDTANFSNNPSVEIVAISTTKILVAAEINKVVANSGNMGKYKLVSVSPNLTSETNPIEIEPNQADSDTNMTIGNLFPGTSYNLTFVNTMQLCNSTRDSDTSIVANICTKPEIPTATVTSSTRTSVSIIGSGITTPSNSTFDRFSVASINPNPFPPDQRPLDSKDFSDNLTITGLTSGTQYLIELVTELGTGATLCRKPVESDPRFVALCTVPIAPSINPDDQPNAAIVNQTSITLIGNLINSSDTYAVVGLLENGRRVSQFTRIQSESAADNVTLGSLEPGKSYTLEVVSVIGTRTDCGGNSADSQISSFNICTDPPDFEATFLPTNSTTIELSSITPRVGWDFFSVASTPSISQTVSNESASSLPLTFYDLAAGSQYKFNVSVSITNFCDLGSNTPSSTIVTVCT